MNIYKMIFICAGFFVCIYCKGQQYNEKIYNQFYFVGSIPDFCNFETYSESEKRLDSIHNYYNKLTDSLFNADTSGFKGVPVDKSDFRNNRSRIFLNSFTNDTPDKTDSSFIKGFPTSCGCFVSKDSLVIKMGAGFFGGLGFNIGISGKKFSSGFYEYTDDVRPFKSNLSDEAFESFVSAKSKYQSLILNEKPNFKAGQQISGYLIMTSHYYYEKKYDDKINTHFVKGNVYFTCKTKAIRN
ncbi:MAG TPA: hypothetical protein PKN48_01875 [Bacteroidales bacterium]|nr:hypothetical protein [Bacteroidales bacterium]